LEKLFQSSKGESQSYLINLIILERLEKICSKIELMSREIIRSKIKFQKYLEKEEINIETSINFKNDIYGFLRVPIVKIN